MLERMFIVSAGFVLDLILGDPAWLWHPVRGIGAVISHTEKILRRSWRISSEREADIGKKRIAGAVLAAVTIGCSVGIPAILFWAAGRIHPWLETGLKILLCYQVLALKSLRVESMKVYQALRREDLSGAREAVSMIVGRDTQSLDQQGIIRATVETVAENTSDGVIAPLCYLMLFGPLGGIAYKAVNTMDSMIGYKNDRYCYFGTAAARLDDALNFLPARISAWGMIVAAFLLGFDGRQAVRIYRRDRYCHASPNSAQTEAVCAGALGVQLAGDAYYFGILYKKPVIGDAGREPEPEDIRRANKLLYVSSILLWLTGMAVMWLCTIVI